MSTSSAVYQQADQYFESLWETARASLAAGNIPAAEMYDGHTLPMNYCVSTVARMVKQPGDIVKRIEATCSTILSQAGDQFVYARDSLHISLLGCTPRFTSKDTFSPAQLAKIQRICTGVLAGTGQMHMQLKGVGLIGNQIFIQVHPFDRRWAERREALAQALIEAGEQPITYANTAPIHLNIIRITDNSKARLDGVYHALQKLRAVEISQLEVTTIEYLITDFVMSDIQVLTAIDLTAASS